MAPMSIISFRLMSISSDIGNPNSSSTQTSLPTLLGLHIVNNPSCILEPPSASSITASATQNPVSVNALFVCNDVCIGVTVVSALVIFSISIGFFLFLGCGCKRNMNRWVWSNNQRRTDSPVAVAAAISLNLRRSRTEPSTSIEPPPLPPYPGNDLPAYPDHSVQSVSINNISSGRSLATHISARYSDSADTSELIVPPIPSIPTISLPPVDNGSNMDNIVHLSLPLQNSSDDTRIQVVDEQPMFSDPNGARAQLAFRLVFPIQETGNNLSEGPISISV